MEKTRKLVKEFNKEFKNEYEITLEVDYKNFCLTMYFSWYDDETPAWQVSNKEGVKFKINDYNDRIKVLTEKNEMENISHILKELEILKALKQEM